MRFAFGRSSRDYPAVPLNEALEWLGLPEWPDADTETVIPVGKSRYNDRNYFLHIIVDENNGIEICTKRAVRDDPALSFKGHIDHENETPQLQLQSLFMFNTHKNAPPVEDVQALFKCMRRGLEEGRAPDGVYGYPILAYERTRAYPGGCREIQVPKNIPNPSGYKRMSKSLRTIRPLY